jgi:hypothetical protein
MNEQEATLVKADHAYLWTDERKVVHIKEPLFSTLQTVINILRSTSRLDFNGAVKITPEI